MAQLIADRRDIDFVLFEQLEVESLLKTEKYNDLNRKMFDMVLTEMRNFGIKELLPTFVEGDREGLRFEDGKVKVPECFHRPYKLFLEGEWGSLMEDPQWGGQGFPSVIARAVGEYLIGANLSLSNYFTEGHGTGKMIELYGTEKQKELFVKKLYTAQWGGTMDLTEPQAGSDVGAITTTAVKNADGTYSLTGNKIFITNGEHDLTENIIHPVLARVEGAPKGTKGISIFIVPKIWVNEDGSLGEANDIVCTGIEEKMGIHASATCSMAMGAKGNCRALLLGEENIGMKIMFHMMNEARLDVGFMGFTNATAAYLYAVNYARERLQGRDLEKGKDPDAPQVPIIRHPDVRRMLLWMKAYVEGMRSFVYYVCYLFDKIACAEHPEEKERCNDLVELFTPVIKAYCAERGFDVCVEAMQVYGGYGYIRDYPIEQLVRDVKIASIFEGTDGIQAMDLLGRKLGMKKGMVFLNFLAEVHKIIKLAQNIEGLKELADKVEKATGQLGEAALHLGKTAMSPDLKVAFAFAFPFLEVVGDVIMAWMLLWRAAVAEPKLKKLAGSDDADAIRQKVAKSKDAAFYDGQIKTAEFFIHTVLPTTIGKMKAISASHSAAVDIHENSFGG